MAAFEVDHRSAILWASSPIPAEVTLEIAWCQESIRFPMSLATGSHNTGFVTVDDLEPDTEYHCRVSDTAGELLAAARFRTAPLPDADAPLRFLVSADIDVDMIDGPSVLGAISGSQADFYVNLGDWPYADYSPAAVTLDEYRQRHWEVRSPAVIRQLLARLPVFAIYDDHEIMCNFDGRDREEQPERVANGLQAWDEFFPLRQQTRYRSWQWGRHAELFLLDTRAYRSADDAPDDGSKTMLGPAQKEWLKTSILQSAASFKLILSSVPFNFCKPVDDWEVFASEREELFGFFREHAVSGLVLLSADRHYFAAHQHPGGLREFHVGPAAAGLGLPAPNVPEVLASAHERNFAEVSISGGASPVLRFSCRGREKHELYAEELDARG